MSAYLHVQDEDLTEKLYDEFDAREDRLSEAYDVIADFVGADEITFRTYSGDAFSGFSVNEPDDYEPPEFVRVQDDDTPSQHTVYGPDERYNEGKKLAELLDEHSVKTVVSLVCDEVGILKPVFGDGHLYRPGLIFYPDNGLFIVMYDEKAVDKLEEDDNIPDGVERITYEQKDELVEQVESEKAA